MKRILRLAGLSLATIIAALALLGTVGNGYLIAQQVIYGRAGSPSANVVTIQGIAGQTPVAVNISGNAAGAGATMYHLPGGSAASTNATLVSSTARTLKSLTLENSQASTAGYFRLYDSSTTPTCSSATGAQPSIPVFAGPGGINVPLPPEGWKLSNGFAFCITGGGGDTDNTAAPTGIFVIASYE